MAKPKKNFESVTTAFISTPAETAAEEPVAESVMAAPEGYVLKKKPKTARIQILITPDLKESVQNKAQREGISVNEYINRLLEDSVK